MQVLSRTFWAAAALAAGVSGCGGGVSIGFNAFSGDDDDLFWRDGDVDVVYMAIRAFDGIAGVERLLASVPNGIERLLGAPGGAEGLTCPGGGSLSTWKQDANRFRLAADNCRLRPNDTLVYDGTWQFQLTAGAGYTAAGTCPAAQACSATATIDTGNARFGYGAANRQAFGRNFRIDTTAAGMRSFAVTASNEPVILNDGTQATANGSLAQLEFRAAGITYRVAGTRLRDRLELDSPYGGTLLLGSAITASLDRNLDGVIDRELSIPWWVFGS